MHLSDLMALAKKKLGGSPRFFFQVVHEEGSKVAQAEVFHSERDGANVPDEKKTARAVGRAPFERPRHDEAGKSLLDPSRDAAIEELAKSLEALPDK